MGSVGMYLKASPPSATPHHGLQGPPLTTLIVGNAGMNFFRLLGDVSHLLAILILLLKIWKTRSCAGISGKSQILFLVVFVTRYRPRYQLCQPLQHGHEGVLHCLGSSYSVLDVCQIPCHL